MGRKKKDKRVPTKPANPNQKTRHHIIPRSRGGKSLENNTCIVIRKNHEAYHELFGNMTPDEIIEELAVNYWNGQWHWLLKALPNRE